MGKVEQFKDEVVGLRPVYSDIGNCTELLLKNGEIVLDRRILASVLKALASSYAVDLKAQRCILRAKVSRKGMLPFYIGDGRVFIPLKFRQARAGKDAVYGYIDLAYLDKPQKADDRGCVIALSNGMQLQVMSPPATVHGARYYGMAVLDLLQPSRQEDALEAMVMQTIRLIIDAISNRVQQLDRIEDKIIQDDES